MIDKLGPIFIWVLFLGACWFWARPVLVFVAGALIVALVVGATLRLANQERQNRQRSWHR